MHSTKLLNMSQVSRFSTVIFTKIWTECHDIYNSTTVDPTMEAQISSSGLTILPVA
jgi:hypothetical protein